MDVATTILFSNKQNSNNKMKEHDRTNVLRLAIMLLLSRGCQGNYEELMLDDLTEKCPYLNTCSRTANQKFPDSSRYTPCCRQCSCDENCHQTNNCCPEVSENTTRVPENLARKHGECISTAYPDQGGNGYSSSAMYYAVTSCPEDYPDRRIAQQCADTTPEDIQQVAFVSDKEGTVYRNMYCAQCHNALNPQRWQVMAICSQSNGSVTFELGLQHIVERGCALLFQPPRNSVGVLEKRCFRPDVTECNVTGSWDVFDPVTARACSTETVQFIRINTVYKSVFCFFCNNEETTIRHDTHACPDLDVLPKKGVFGPTYVALLNPDLVARSDTPPSRETAGCKFNEIYDSNAGVCRELHCPPGDAISNGKCEQAFLRTDGFSMKLFFKIQPTDARLVPANFDETVQLINGVNSFLVKKMKKKCVPCYFSSYRHPSVPDEYFLKQIITTKAKCSFSDIVDFAKSVDKADVTVELAGNETRFTVDHVLVHVDEQKLSPRIRFYYYSNCAPDGVPAIDFLCPYVEISGLDYVTALREGKLRQTHHYATYNMSGQTDNELGNITFRICVQDYLQQSSAVGVVMDIYAVLVVCLLAMSEYSFL